MFFSLNLNKSINNLNHRNILNLIVRNLHKKHKKKLKHSNFKIHRNKNQIKSLTLKKSKNLKIKQKKQ